MGNAKKKTETKENVVDLKTEKAEKKAAAKKEFEETMKEAKSKLKKAKTVYGKSSDKFAEAKAEFKATKKEAKIKRNTVIKQTVAWISFGIVAAVTVVTALLLTSGNSNDESPEIDNLVE